MALAQVPTPPAAVGELVVGSVTFGSIVGHWVGYVPGTLTAIGGAIGIVYYCLQIWKDGTVQAWMRAWRQRRISKYKGKITALEKVDQ
jgi:hypothetical protein